ncbi:MAG TPA: Holliday junction branch migration protein RuvA [Bellilinea sp.]|nr:Holliday junction branch migration protein RuvA [Bellilinea sp.]
MIVHLQGEVVAAGQDSLTLQMGGFGVRVYVPTVLAKQSQPGEMVFLHTSLIVREDGWSIYGFEHEIERDFFVLLLAVNGIGPRLALSILSTLSVDVIRRAVLAEQADLFTRVPGIGKKTGQKIVLYLQGKVGEAGEMRETLGILDLDTEVLEALTGLGYSVIEAQTAIQSIPRDASKDVEARLRIALQFFNK